VSELKIFKKRIKKRKETKYNLGKYRDVEVRNGTDIDFIDTIKKKEKGCE